MKKISFAHSLDEIKLLDQLGVHEIIVSSKEISRFSRISIDDLISFISIKKSIKAQLILEWDILSQEKNFKKSADIFERLPLHEFSVVRLQDPGAVNLVKEKYPWLKIQLILETGNHNLIGLKRFYDFLGSQLDRLVLSNELSREHLETYCREVKVPIEILVFGRILLFYSPRELLAPVLNKKEEYLEASGTSEESPHSGFPLIENSHGTFMFNVKDLSLLDHIEELEKIKVEAIRFDLRFDQFMNRADLIINYKNSNQEKIIGPRPFIKGFYNVNKTDVLFVKLKNRKIARKDELYVGEIVDVERDKQLCILFKNQLIFKQDLQFKIITPEGKVKIIKSPRLRTTDGLEVQLFQKDEIALMSFTNGITVKSQVYLDSST